MRALISQVINDPNFSNSSIRHALRRHIPSGTIIGHKDAVNFRVWAKKKALKATADGNMIITQAEMSKDIFNWATNDTPEATKMCGEVLQEALHNVMSNQATIFVYKLSTKVLITESKLMKEGKQFLLYGRHHMSAEILNSSEMSYSLTLANKN